MLSVPRSCLLVRAPVCWFALLSAGSRSCPPVHAPVHRFALLSTGSRFYPLCTCPCRCLVV